jgi:hypothetical protein
MEISPKELQEMIDAAVAKALGRPTCKQSLQVPDSKPEDLMKPLSVLDDMSEDEIKYWATPYFDELQEMKAKAKRVAD